MPMSDVAKELDQFNSAYRDRIRDALWNAMIETARDPASGIVTLRNYELYDALLQLQAKLLASSKAAASPAKMREISNHLAKRLRRHIAEFKRIYDRDGIPFDVIHTDEMQ
jgi:hypothetical protein